MIFKTFSGYIEGMDIEEIPQSFFAFPSKNVLIHKGVASTRPGIENDGTAATSADDAIIGERVWKDALGGEKALRVTQSGKVQVKWAGTWITIFSGVTPTAVRVRFDTWIDDSGAIIKKRIFFVDGTDAIYEWNGAIATIASISGQTVTFSENSTGLKLGFDDGSSTPQAVEIIRKVGNTWETPDAYTTDSAMSGQTIHMTSAIVNSPAAGDIVVGAVVKHSDKLTGVNKDDIYTYKNHIGVANLDSITVYFSNAETKLDYVIPAANMRTALSPFLINLDQNYTAMISRFDAALKESVLWISSVDDWLKIIALDAANSNGEWVDTQQIAEAERTGAVPFCVAQQKGDIIFLSQDHTVQRITTIDVLAKDTLQLLSDEVEGLLSRLDDTEARIYYLKRYIYIVYPAESIVVALDVVENHWQTPWTIGINVMSVISGVLYGHSNVTDETFYMLKGTNDLGAEIVSVFAFGYYKGFQLHRGTRIFPQDFELKDFTTFAISGRMNAPAQADVELLFETDGAKAKETYNIDGSNIKTYALPDDESWATHEWGTASIGGSDDAADPLRRFFAFREYNALSWFDFRPIITVTGKEQQFTLLAWSINDSLSDVVIPEELYIAR